MIRKIFSLLVLFISLVLAVHGQVNKPLNLRIAEAPDTVLKMFVDAGMQPTNHKLSAAELEKVEKAFSNLPPLHQEILAKHLKSISFLDGMPNTALTSPVSSNDSLKQFNITFRAGILNESITEWLNKKEITCFKSNSDNDITVQLDGGNLDAIQYVFLHEATHVVDAVKNLTPKGGNTIDVPVHTVFTKGIWSKMNLPMEQYVLPVLEQTRFRSGKVVSSDEILKIYPALNKTPFVSLYGMASWHEDIAELLTVYHLTHKMNQPFKILILQHNKVVMEYEPTKNPLVQNRFKYLDVFYKS